MIIIFVCANLNSGGAERVMSLLANQFIENRHEVEFLFLKNDSCRKRMWLNISIQETAMDEEIHQI